MKLEHLGRGREVCEKMTFELNLRKIFTKKDPGKR